MNISTEDFLVKGPSPMELKPKILSYRAQEELLDKWLLTRLETILPRIMKRSGIDCWVVACREYNEDPVLKTLTPCAMMTARRTTILLFHLENDQVKRYALTRPGVGLDHLYEAVWTNPKGADWADSKSLMPFGKVHPDKNAAPCETQMECLNRMLKTCNPKKIGINVSRTFAFADGLTHDLYLQIMEALDDNLKERIVSAEDVCVGWLETRSEEEMAAYAGIMQIAHSMIAEAFSSKVIVPGVTTNLDVKYFMMQRVIDLGLEPWFDFEVSVRRKDVNEVFGETIIMPGDLLHCDVGLRYLNLCTDTQENAYVLKLGETDAPEELKEALRTVNRLQDITISNLKAGRSGNEILALSLKQAKDEGIVPCIYTHPIGFDGHAAGPTIGLWDMQGGVPGQGDYLMYDDTAYSLELNCKCEIKSWNVTLTLGAETDVLFTEGKAHYLAGRQESFHLVK
ncbi:MAG: aminopeptidase P family protein [Erysipelotrichaceae bacterium]|nr:aminopeptidase P family protein [Erysipelotrichaceae bacterium]